MSNLDLVVKMKRLSECASIWDGIYAHSPNAMPFISFEWFNALSENLLNMDPKIMVFFDGKHPIGIVPVRIEDSTLRCVIDERVTDITDAIYLPQFEERLFEALSSFITENDLALYLAPLDERTIELPSSRGAK